jgi:hypothetical protein
MLAVRAAGVFASWAGKRAARREHEEDGGGRAQGAAAESIRDEGGERQRCAMPSSKAGKAQCYRCGGKVD